MKPRSHKNAILPRSSQDVNLEEEVPDSPSSSDNDSVGSQVQAEVNANDYIPNLVPAKPQKALLILEEEVQGWYDTITKENADFDPEDAVIAETAEPPPDLIKPLLNTVGDFDEEAFAEPNLVEEHDAFE